MSKRLGESTAEEDTDQEKKQRPSVYAPEFFHRNTITKATVKTGKQYKANDDKTQFVPPAVLGAHNFEFMGCMNPWGPDALVLIYPPPGKTAKDRLTLDVHRKTAEAKEFRVVYRHKENEIEMTATETDDSFEVKGPDFELKIEGRRKVRPGQLVCQKAKTAAETLMTMTNEAMAKIEARISSFCPDFPLQWVGFLNNGQWRMRFATDDDRYIHIDSLTHPTATVRKDRIEITESLNIAVFISKPYFQTHGPVDKALQGLEAFFINKNKNSA